MTTTHKTRALFIALFFMLFTDATAAFAKIDKKTRAELTSYATKFEAVTETNGKVGWLFTSGALLSKKELAALEAYKSNDDEDVRLAAGIALWRAGDKKALKFVSAEFASHSKRLRALETYIAALDDKAERKLLDVLIKGAKPEIVRDLFRYAIKTKPHDALVLKALNDKKSEALRKSAWEALGSAEPKMVMTVIDKKRADKREAERTAALSLAIAWLDSPKWGSKAAKSVEAFAKKDASNTLRERAARALVERSKSGGGDLFFDAVWANPKPDGRVAALKFIVDSEGSVDLTKLKPLLESKNNEERLYAYMLAAKKDKKLADKLQELYRSIEPEDRIIGVSAIGYTRSKTALAVLSTAVFEGDPKIRMAAVKGLQVFASEAGVDLLKTALGNEKDKQIKLQIVDALGAVKSKKALQILRFQVGGNDAVYKRRVVQAIRRIGLPEGAKALDVLIKDRNVETQWATFLAMATLNSKAASKHYKSVFRNPPAGYLDDVDALDPGVRRQIYAYLFKSGGPSVKSEIVARGLRHHEFLKNVYGLIDSGELSDAARRDIAYHQYEYGKNARPAIERFARTTLSKPLARNAMWILLRKPSKNDEPTFRGILGSKDASMGALAMYGLTKIKE